jgi:hypothetical protein
MSTESHLLATAAKVNEIILAESNGDELPSLLQSLLGCARDATEHRKRWQALALLWPQYTRSASLKVLDSSLSDAWWTFHHALHELAQGCEETAEVILIRSTLGLYAAQVCSSGRVMLTTRLPTTSFCYIFS